MTQLCCLCFSPSSSNDSKENDLQKHEDVADSEKHDNNKPINDKSQFSAISGVRITSFTTIAQGELTI